jgi:hypothetical protein
MSGKTPQYDERLDELLDVLVDELFARLEGKPANAELNRPALPEAP